MRSLVMARVEFELPMGVPVPPSIARDCFVTALEGAMFEYCAEKSSEPDSSWGSLYLIRKDSPWVALISFGAEDMQDMWWEEDGGTSSESSVDSDEAVVSNTELHLSISYFQELVVAHLERELTNSWPHAWGLSQHVRTQSVINLI
ncbi:E4 ORFC [Murine mastadenovirus A]|uniref:E4 ORFC n=1 Tax=Murine mastadenovirus A TaxID=129956 RepID=UPI00001D96CC|nr:E4 ORFC [Murine mastadenovirus A]